MAERDFAERSCRVLDAVEEVADEDGASPAQVSLAWLLYHPDGTAPVAGARTVDQLEVHLGASDVTRSAAPSERLTEAYEAAGR